MRILEGGERSVGMVWWIGAMGGAGRIDHARTILHERIRSTYVGSLMLGG